MKEQTDGQNTHSEPVLEIRQMHAVTIDFGLSGMVKMMLNFCPRSELRHDYHHVNRLGLHLS